MKNIFEELKPFGFGNLEKLEIFTSHQEKEKKNEGKHVNKCTVEEILYDKSYVCPVCNNQFKAKTIRSGKNRLMTVDLDLRPVYDIVNPLIYEPIVCEKCGYSALAKNFNTLSTMQMRWIKEQICANYKAHHFSTILTPQEAIYKYKLVLLNAVVKKAKDGEKAYICLKTAWLYRDLGDEENEKIFLNHALTGFLNAYNKERFPIFELGELTVAYIIAELYRRFKEYDKALQWISCVILDRGVTLRLKTKALHLKSVIREERDKAKEKQS
nr:DUF2225 domain-containing protein [uncultured Cellulosilyticum sp.]